MLIGGGTVGIRCPRCDSAEADIVHIFATCPHLQPVLSAVVSFMSNSLGVSISANPAWVILGVSGDYEQHPKFYFVFVAMAVLRLCIATLWLDKEPPTFRQWLAKLLSIYNLEKRVYARKGRKGRILGECIWEPMAKWKDSM